MKEKKVLNGKMRSILLAIHRNSGAMTMNEIKVETEFSYKTVKKYIKILKELQLIKEIASLDKVKKIEPKSEDKRNFIRGPIIRWSINYDKMQERMEKGDRRR